jgi:hypothetical protein
VIFCNGGLRERVQKRDGVQHCYVHIATILSYSPTWSYAQNHATCDGLVAVHEMDGVQASSVGIRKKSLVGAVG